MRAGHQAAGFSLAATLSGLPGEGVHPHDPDTLDILEEVIHHMLAAGRARDAWDIYSNRLGRYSHLGGATGGVRARAAMRRTSALYGKMRAASVGSRAGLVDHVLDQARTAVTSG